MSIKKFPFLKKILPTYHLSWSGLSAFFYRYPSRKIFVVGITGTKGKTSSAEMVSTILEEAGYKTALAGTLRFKIGDKTYPNKLKMTMPGRGKLQKFLRQAVDAHCDYAILEMTSEGSTQFRHRFIDLNTLIVTNLSPEHIESHGSFENYLEAKLQIVDQLNTSVKKDKMLIINGDDTSAKYFLERAGDIREISYNLSNVENLELTDEYSEFSWGGKKIRFSLPGKFNVYNALAAMVFARTQGITDEIIVKAMEKFTEIKGRVQKIKPAEIDFRVFVDYAHTADSLEQLYQTFANQRKICVLGATGGGRDKWKRPEMGKVADKYCDEIILTNEDPYDEDPEEIIKMVAEGITSKKPTIIIDRREAIREALNRAQKDDVVLFTGKGTDPYIMGPKGSKIPWDEAKIVQEELNARITRSRNS